MQMAGIRRAGIDDIEQLLALDEGTARGDLERASELRGHVGAGNCYVSLGAGQIDGYVVVTPRHFFGRDFVDLLFVTSKARRSGIGRRLLRAAIELEGTRQVFTSTNRSNTAMRELLKQEGWQHSGELDGLDAGDPENFYFVWRT
jgi:GNAT superfamily N-acetyltransferase